MGCPVAKNLEISFLLDFYGDVLTERQREVMEQYYNDDLSLAEIADNFGITRQGVRDSIKRGEGIILDLEQKVGFAARYRAVQQGVAQLESLARSIRFANSNSYSPNAEIERDVDQMLEEIRRITD
ncbi:MAG TPA: YlxM family DNA-binding protein [Candidatus Fournierella excrementavium]|nr:YlxM family DNA-binding protein [Candidatus Fournierella excrementavium]